MEVAHTEGLRREQRRRVLLGQILVAFLFDIIFGIGLPQRVYCNVRDLRLGILSYI